MPIDDINSYVPTAEEELINDLQDRIVENVAQEIDNQIVNDLNHELNFADGTVTFANNDFFLPTTTTRLNYLPTTTTRTILNYTPVTYTMADYWNREVQSESLWAKYINYGEDKRTLEEKNKQKSEKIKEEAWDIVNFINNDNDNKTEEWFHTAHPQFNGISPYNMCNDNKAEDVLKYIKNANIQKLNINEKIKILIDTPPLKKKLKKSFMDFFITDTIIDAPPITINNRNAFTRY